MLYGFFCPVSGSPQIVFWIGRGDVPGIWDFGQRLLKFESKVTVTTRMMEHGGLHKWGLPQNRWLIMKNSIKVDDD